MYTSNSTMSLLLLIVSAAALVTPGAPTPERLELSRSGCENCPSENGQSVFFTCKLSPCRPGRFSIGFYRILHSGPLAIHTNTTLFPGGPVVNVTELESSDNTCGKVLAFTASDSLQGTVLQCIATGYSRHIFSMALAVALEGHFGADSETASKDHRTDCGCPDNCTTDPPSELTSASFHYSPNVVLMVLALAFVLSLIELC